MKQDTELVAPYSVWVMSQPKHPSGSLLTHFESLEAPRTAYLVEHPLLDIVDDANTLDQEPFAIVNARLGYEFNNYGIYLFTNNLFDKEYVTNAFAFGPGAVDSFGAPATYGVQVRGSF